ncbi:MAG: T9SS type A sorting domain-containing protein [Bacteroidota bacterium]
MRKLSSLLFALMIVASAGAQNLIKPSDLRVQTVDLRQDLLRQRQQEQVDFSQRPGDGSAQALDPIGTTYSDQITAFKIGESRNAFSFIAGRDKQISVVSGVGTNGGSVAFIYRHNVDVCGGVQPTDNGRYRYSISTDGGQSWDVGGGVTVSDGNAAPAAHCFGKGEINPTYTRFSRYPNMAMFLDPTAANPTTADLNLVYVGPVLLGSSGWDGHVAGSVSDAAGTPVVEQEVYVYQSGDQYLPASLIERVPGEFWYVANTGNDAQGNNINVNKGIWDPTTKEVAWSTVTTIVPNHFIFDGGTVNGIPHIAFSPDGQTGYIAHPGDLVGKEDTTISPIFYESLDGGNTWTNGFEFDMSTCSELRDSLLSQLTVDSVSPTQIDTVPFLTGKASIVFDFELTVDAKGNPHYFTYVSGASSPFNPDGSAAGYFFYPGIITFMYDITKDAFGDWNMMYIASQSTYDASFGDFSGGTGSEWVTSGPKAELSRSEDGNYVFYSWVDSDTTLPTYSPQADPNTPGSQETNTSPELQTRAYDVLNNKLTDIVDRTAGDANFGTRAILPRPSYTALEDGNTLTVPTVIMDLVPGTSTLNPVSYVYISDVSWDKTTDFTIDPFFCYNCKENPFSNSVTELKPDCGVSDGSLSVTTGGGIAPYTITWSTGATGTSVNNLAAGLYSVTVEDTVGCKDEISFTLNNANAPVPTIGSVADITCNGAGDGTATVTVTGGAGSETYSWSNGEAAATATMLPAGTTTVEITDANGCKSFSSVTITEPAAINIDISSSAVNCAGEGNGSASAIASGGTGMLTYSWDNGETTATINGLAGAVYTVFVTDENNCTESAQIAVDEPAPITVAGSVSPNSGTSAAPNGTASASASGGTSPFTYDWVALSDSTTFNNAPFIFGLCEGDYQVTVTDDAGCTVTDTVTVTAIGDGCSVGIEEELAAGIQTMQLLPNPNNGAFSLRLELDRPEDISIEIVNISGQVIAREDVSRVLAHDQSFQLQNVSSGIYLVKVTTSRGTATQKVVIQ